MYVVCELCSILILALVTTATVHSIHCLISGELIFVVPNQFRVTKTFKTEHCSRITNLKNAILCNVIESMANRKPLFKNVYKKWRIKLKRKEKMIPKFVCLFILSFSFTVVSAYGAV